ncbi:MAG TPA: right-handed parallel beta-helix repeat-containing protein [Marmoricola sp.]
MRRLTLALALALGGILVAPQMAQAHVERPSYWPDPTPDCSVSPCAGGEIPTARSLASALDDVPGSTTRVVCKSDSMQLLDASIANALAHGYDVRPTDHRSLSQSDADALRATNQALFDRCGYHEIQAAITASGNDDRVVVMPGLYTEPTAASQPTYDPACEQYKTHSDSGDPGALSHAYQFHCPNDANLVAVIGRDVSSDPVPDPPLVDRHGIPSPGACIRCNLQLEGSGVSADDVIVEAGDKNAGNGGPSAAGHRKDVGIFVDRADGFVLRNLTVRHAREHDIYVLETDGYLLDQFKTYYAGGYGVLTFVADHAQISNCESAGNGDSGVYPGSSAPTLVGADKSFYPDAPRYSTRLTQCDLHHNTGGFSGTNSSGVRIDHNNFFDNALGFTTDVFTAAGHPGFPQHGNVIEDNNFYDNNFNPFQAGSDVEPFIGAPVGTGLWLAGGNANTVRNNSFWDNWRRGLMLFAVPDATVCGPVLGSSTPVPGCSTTSISTSYNNKIYGNKMGVAPDGSAKPNGTDLWWDSFPTNTGNCFWNNTGPNGKKATTNSLLGLPGCLNGAVPGLSIGLGNIPAEAELLACLAGYQLSGYPHGEEQVCSWPLTPTPPGSAPTTSLGAVQKQLFKEYCDANTGSRTCAPYLLDILNLSFIDKLLAPLKALLPSVTPAASSDTKPLSLYTCSWWRQANDEQKLGLVQRLRHFAGGAVEGDKLVGYGNVMSNAAATQMFDDRCSTGYAGAFALYKIYGAAAAFAGSHG